MAKKDFFFNIQKAQPGDASHIVGFQQKMAFETEGKELDVQTLIKGVDAVFNNPDKGFYLLVENAGNPVASVLLTPEWSDWRNSTFLWIQSLYVIPSFRKQGVFRQIYDHVKAMVNASDDYAGIKLYVDEHNIIAQKAYLKVGMEQSHYRLFEWEK